MSRPEIQAQHKGHGKTCEWFDGRRSHGDTASRGCTRLRPPGPGYFSQAKWPVVIGGRRRKGVPRSWSTRCRAGGLLLLACVMLAAGGCSGSDDGGGRPRGGPPAPTTPNPVGLTFRATALGAPNPSDGRDYRTREYQGHHGLDAISADEAYQRGYFGQDVTIAVADDGLDPTHPDLAGRIRAPRHVRNRNANVFEPGRAGDLGTGHGTYVALLAAGARDNAGGTFEIRAAGGGAIPTYNVHGVAPQASIMPIQLAGGGQPLQAIDHAAANRAQVLNFSIGITQHYYGRYAGRDGVWLTVGKPLFRPLLNLDLVGR
ncbi:MAG: S8 family serine peptidase, partial [Deltaproteobacteria bacterium]|nr:S8 family serine peptidase [Deltaproteobacteria bacterium]